MADDFAQGLVGFSDAGVLDVHDRVHLVLEHQRPPAVLPPETGERRALAARALAVEVQLRRPPSLDAVLQLEPRAEEAPAAALGTEDRIETQLQAARLLHVMAVGDEGWALLGLGRRGETHREGLCHQLASIQLKHKLLINNDLFAKDK